MTAGLVLSAVLAAAAGDLIVSPPRAAQGDIVVVRAGGEPVELTLGDRSPGGAIFYRDGDASVALLGIDAEAKPGKRRLLVHWDERDAAVDLQVTSKKFPTEKLRVEPKYVEPPADVIGRIVAEKERLDALWRQAGRERLWREPFVAPVGELPSSAFGLQRVFNGQRRSPHNGVDFRVAAGVPVAAANAGRVAVAEDLYFTGNTVIVDHGLGLYTVYAHLREIAVRAGDDVGRGAVVGRVGATGRATGPHLHWGSRLLEARVDPMQLLELEKRGVNGKAERRDL